MIREASPSDYEAMETVFRTSAQRLCRDSYDNQIIDEWTGEYWPERFAKSANEGNEQYVLLHDQQVVCFGSLNLEKSLLVSLFVHADSAGQGLGQKMIEFLFARAKNKGLEKLTLDSSLNALSFYLKNGFVETGRSKYQTQSGLYMESVQMQCQLN